MLIILKIKSKITKKKKDDSFIGLKVFRVVERKLIIAFVNKVSVRVRGENKINNQSYYDDYEYFKCIIELQNYVIYIYI